MAGKQLSVAAEKRMRIRSVVAGALKAGVSDLLPDYLTPESVAAAFAGCLTRDPMLLECTPASFVEALVLAASAGLPPDGYHAHLVRFKNEVVYIPDFKGMVQVALRNGIAIDAHVVYEKDEFRYQLGSEPRIVHIPYEGEDRGALRCAYAIARFNGISKFVVATKADIEKRKAASAGSRRSDSPWNKWEAEMWCKTAVKMLSKYLPRTSSVMTQMMRVDDMTDIGRQSDEARAIAETHGVGLGDLTRAMAAQDVPASEPSPTLDAYGEGDGSTVTEAETEAEPEDDF